MMTTTQGISEMALAEVSRRVADQMGLHIPPDRYAELADALECVASELGCETGWICAERLLSSKFSRELIETLAGYLTVGETYFFRVKKHFDVLETEIIPGLIKARKGGQQYLRIWSAGCCTGEEPYSIAIVVHKLISDLKEWNITILATDINPSFLERARRGIYREWSFRSAPLWLQSQYFTKTKAGEFELRPEIRRMVTFSYLNLAEDAYPSIPNNTNAMDVIFCRNVTMYFKQGRTRQISKRFHRAVIDGGWLIVSPSEAASDIFADFSVVRPSGTILFTKDGARAPRREVEQPLPVVEPVIQDPVPATQVLPQEAERAAVVENEVSPVSYELALEHYEKGEYREVLECVPSCFDGASNPAEHFALAAKACANLGEFEQAISWCDKAVVEDKMRADLYYLKAAILQGQNRTQEAIEFLGRAIYVEPEFVLAHFMLGNLSLNDGRQDTADKHFANTLDLLGKLEEGAIVPESGGMTAGRLMRIIEMISGGGLQNTGGIGNEC